MPPSFLAEEDDADDVREFLASIKGLNHLRVRRRADLLNVESGPQDDPIRHMRLRRVSVHLWRVECATHTGRWEKTPFRGLMKDILPAIASAFPWVLAPRD